MRKMQSFNENMLGKFLGFGRMHENKIYFFQRIFEFFLEFSVFFLEIYNII
jgi:hypothetical protein